jgi:sec-independent protein translocase protein TatB
MIDIGMSKLAVIGVTALIVLGPERLPRVARLAGTLYGRAQRYLQEVKSEVARQIEMEELRALREQARDGARSFKAEVESVGDQLGRLGTEVAAIAPLHVHAADAAPRGDVAPVPAPAVPGGDTGRGAHAFRTKKLAKTSGIPAWYRKRRGSRRHAASGAARARRLCAGPGSGTSFF